MDLKTELGAFPLSLSLYQEPTTTNLLRAGILSLQLVLKLETALLPTISGRSRIDKTISEPCREGGILAFALSGSDAHQLPKGTEEE